MKKYPRFSSVQKMRLGIFLAFLAVVALQQILP
jgi:hypothetical protein